MGMPGQAKNHEGIDKPPLLEEHRNKADLDHRFSTSSEYKTKRGSRSMCAPEITAFEDRYVM
jgi:hypothetical protein